MVKTRIHYFFLQFAACFFLHRRESKKLPPEIRKISPIAKTSLLIINSVLSPGTSWSFVVRAPKLLHIFYFNSGRNAKRLQCPNQFFFVFIKLLRVCLLPVVHPFINLFCQFEHGGK